MEIQFNSATTIEEIQQQFTSAFPHLKLGFFNDLNKDQVLTADELIKNEKTKLSALTSNIDSGKLIFEPNRSINDFEKSVLEQYGLQVQIFRKSGNTWLITLNTDNKTFGEQELMALEMNNPVDRPLPNDYQEHD